MPRAGWRKPESDRRLSDLLGVLTRVFPPALVDEVTEASGRTQVRHRALPARVMAYFAIGMGLYSDGSYEDVLSQITDGLAWASGWRERYPLPSKSAIFQTRGRLGSAPLEQLFARVAAPMGGPQTPGVWLAGRRLVAIDGTCLDVADTPVNDAFFGRPGVNKGEKSAFPQARLLALAECGTRAIFAATIGAYRDAESTMVEHLLTAMAPGMVVLADRGFFSYRLWRTVSETGADLLWRVSTGGNGPAPVRVEDLPDGSWLAHLRAHRDRDNQPMLARIIDYTLDDGRGNPTVYRLVTTLLDPIEAPALELAAAYAQRWEIENVFDELKTHQRGSKVVFRSKSPDLALQEIWGYLCCHYAIRCLMTQATDHDGRDPDRISFVAALRIVRQSVAQQGAFSP